MKKTLLIAVLCIFALLGGSVAALAQNQDKQAETKPQARTFVRRDGQVMEVPNGSVVLTEPRVQFSTGTAGAGGLAPQVQVVQSGFQFDSHIVKGAPYAADAVTENIQTLGDGNRITRNSTAKTYRDSAGRTRREQELSAVGAWAVSGETPRMIYISDPVAGVHYTLDPRTKTATKVTVQRVSNVSGDNVVINDVGVGGKVSVRADGSSDRVRFVTDDNRTFVLSDGMDKAVAEVRAKAAAGGVVSGVTSSGGNTFTFIADGDANREPLGTRMIEGVQAEGTRTSFTIPAGKIGNERPIVTTSERWYAPELQAVVLSKTSDPRMGENTYRLANIVRAEPDPTLFQVPPDYTIKESGFNFTTRADEMLKKIEAERKAKKQNDN
jgi:hypothetical protein